MATESNTLATSSTVATTVATPAFNTDSDRRVLRPAENSRAPLPSEPATAGKSLKKKLLRPIILLLLLAVVGLKVHTMFFKPHYGPNAKVPNGATIELATSSGNGSITTNLSDGHLVQLGVSLQMTAVGSAKVESKDSDALMGATLSQLSQETYDQLLTPQGRADLATSLLHAYQHVLGKVDGANQISAVYFTSFVLQ